MWTIIIDKLKDIFQHLDSWKKLWIVLTLVFGLSVISLAYNFASNMINNGEYYQSLARRLMVDAKIDPIMEHYREVIDADRLFVAELHDGKKNTSGVRFAYMSGTYESDRLGLSQVIMSFQNIPTSMMSTHWIPLIKGECVYVDDPLAPLMVHFEEIGVTKILACPVIAPEGKNLIGVLISTWTNKPEEYVAEEMDKAALIISGLINEARD